MKCNVFIAFAVMTLASASALAGDLPSRYGPPPVISGGNTYKSGRSCDCRIGPSVGLVIVGFQKNYSVLLTPDGPGPVEAYVGNMAILGVDSDYRRWRSDVGGVRADQKHDAWKSLRSLRGRKRQYRSSSWCRGEFSTWWLGKFGGFAAVVCRGHDWRQRFLGSFEYGTTAGAVRSSLLRHSHL